MVVTHTVRLLRRLILSATCGAGLLATGCGDHTPVPLVVQPPIPQGVDDLHGTLESVRAQYGLPGIAAAVFSTEGLRAVGAAGTRKVGSGVPLLFTDRLSIASITKTMTATIVARLIERGELSWDSTLLDLYPELATTMRPEFRGVTVEQLLRHRAGLPRWMSHDDVVKAWVRQHPSASNHERRYEAVKYIVARPLDHPPGTRSAYTNDAYLVLGSICERVSGRDYETLLREEVFEPLEMTTVGFQEPWSDRSLDHPWGHVRQRGHFVPYDPDPEGYGGVPFGTPYGAGVHASVVDIARYGMFHLRGDLGLEASLLTGSSFRRLHHAAPVDVGPATQVAAAGFFNEGRADGDGRWTNVQHWGYYARGRTLLWFSPQANVGAVVITNGTDEDEAAGMQPISELVVALFQRYRVR